jgi:NAD-dependent deacetylase
MDKLVVFSGAGISAESGIATFRDSGGLWEKHRIEDVATPEAFARNPKKVLDFYNLRRRQIGQVEPNLAHLALVELEKNFEVSIVTQNIDDLHERAGSSRVIHLHGEITWAFGGHNRFDRISIGFNDIQLGDLSPLGEQLRPDIVWFGEDVPKYEDGLKEISKADVLIVVGTSLNVYPAAGLIHYAPKGCKRFLIDPNLTYADIPPEFEIISDEAGIGIPKLVQRLLSAI